jgi:3-hydroxyacyl-[acyl-carrier-protein] dehydratase
VLLEAARRLEGQTNVHALLTMVDRARFRRVVRPGDKLDLVADMLIAREDGGQVKGTASVDGVVVATAELGFALAQVTHPVLIARRQEYLDIWLSGSTAES